MSQFERLKNFSDLASANAGGKILFATDDWFAPAEHLLMDEEPVFEPGVYTEFGKLMDGWETRRKRIPGHDWCIIKLGRRGVIRGIDVDTAYFTGNYSPRFSLQAARLEDKDLPKLERLGPDQMIGTAASEKNVKAVETLRSHEWKELVPMTPLSAGYESTRHNYFEISSDETWTHLRLNMFPDGGIARLRIYGEIRSSLPAGKEIDLLAVENGGTCVKYTNAHYGHPKNLTKPGRGVNMSDGWETARRLDRPPILSADQFGFLNVVGNEWAVFKLAGTGIITQFEIDTAHFKGNFPDNVKIEGLLGNPDKQTWKDVLPATKLKANSIHTYQTQLVDQGPFDHLKITMAPDGGISRVRAFGTVL